MFPQARLRILGILNLKFKDMPCHAMPYAIRVLYEYDQCTHLQYQANKKGIHAAEHASLHVSSTCPNQVSAFPGQGLDREPIYWKASAFASHILAYFSQSKGLNEKLRHTGLSESPTRAFPRPSQTRQPRTIIATKYHLALCYLYLSCLTCCLRPRLLVPPSPSSFSLSSLYPHSYA